MSRIRTNVDNTFMVKVLSLVSAIALWFFVMNEQNPVGESSFNVPVVVVDAPEGMQVTLEEETARVTLRAPRSLFSALDKADIRVVASLNGMEEGTENVRLHAVIPQGFELVGVSPDNVSVRLEPIVEKQFEVSLIRAGSVAPEMVVSATRPLQRIVNVTGPRSKVEQVAKVIGYVGLTADRTQDFTLNVPLSAVTAEGHGIEGLKLSPNKIDVEIQLVKGLAKKTIDIKPILDGTLRNGYAIGSVKVTPSRVEIAGSNEAVGNLQQLYTEKIALDELTKSEKRTIRLNLPDNVTAAVEQVTVEIEVNKK